MNSCGSLPSPDVNELHRFFVKNAFLRVGVLADKAGKSMLVWKFSRENYKTVEIVADRNQITKVLYPLWETLAEHNEEVRFCTKRNGFDYIGHFLTITARSNLDCDNIATEALL